MNRQYIRGPGSFPNLMMIIFGLGFRAKLVVMVKASVYYIPSFRSGSYRSSICPCNLLDDDCYIRLMARFVSNQHNKVKIDHYNYRRGS